MGITLGGVYKLPSPMYSILITDLIISTSLVINTGVNLDPGVVQLHVYVVISKSKQWHTCRSNKFSIYLKYFIHVHLIWKYLFGCSKSINTVWVFIPTYFLYTPTAQTLLGGAIIQGYTNRV